VNKLKRTEQTYTMTATFDVSEQTLWMLNALIVGTDLTIDALVGRIVEGYYRAWMDDNGIQIVDLPAKRHLKLIK